MNWPTDRHRVRFDQSGAIVDKSARIGPHVRMEPFPTGTEIFEDERSVRGGIVAIPKNGILPAGAEIKPQFLPLLSELHLIADLAIGS